MTLRTKMITASTLVTSAILLALAVITLRYVEGKQYETVIQQQQATVNFTAAEVDATLQLAKEQLAASAKAFPSAAVHSGAAATDFLRSRTGLHRLFNRHLLLLSPEGTLLAESQALPGTRRKDYAAEPFFRQTVATLQPQVSDPLRCCSSDSNEDHILISAPVLDQQGRLQAVMAGAFNLRGENILTRFTRVSTGKDSFIRLINSSYQVVAHTNPQLTLKTVSSGHHQLVQDALNGFNGTRSTIGREGNQLYTTAARLKSVDWVLAASYPQTNITQPIKTVRSFFIAAIAVASVALLVVVSGYMGYLTAPLKRFTRHLQQLPLKDGAERLFPVTSNDELGQMAKTFNELLIALDNQTEELHVQNANLEQEMGERQKLQEELHLQNLNLEGEIAERQKLQEELQLEQRELATLNADLERRVTEELAKNREKDHQLLQQERLVVMGELLSALSHQWRQPINNVGLLIQQLQLAHAEGSLTSTAIDGFSTESLAIINALSRTLDDFRNFFQEDRQPTSFDPVARVEVVVNLARPTFEANGIQLDFQGEGDTRITGHCNEFTRALMTILGNAREVLQRRQIAAPRIIVRCTAQDGHAVVTIADNAGGIPQEAIERIFDPYFTTKFMSQGTGLGLFMCKTVIERVMHGSLTARNTAEGAEFKIEI